MSFHRKFQNFAPEHCSVSIFLSVLIAKKIQERQKGRSVPLVPGFFPEQTPELKYYRLYINLALILFKTQL